MNYRLVVLTHGESIMLDDTLRSFHEHVTVKPSEYVCIRDGGGRLPPINPDGQTWRGAVLQPQQGFCVATRAAWRAATLPGPEYVFWLEHDFHFTREVEVDAMAAALDENPNAAQMALVRNAENGREQRAGGLVASWPDGGELWHVFHEGGEFPYLLHGHYFTTNPSLMRTRFMVANPWPEDGEECEGKFGLYLREQGYVFGAWGDGTEWVEHTGKRDGFGY